MNNSNTKYCIKITFSTTTGNKVPSAESAALQSKIASLQAQLTSARRDAHSNVALWDKWKRYQNIVIIKKLLKFTIDEKG